MQRIGRSPVDCLDHVFGLASPIRKRPDRGAHHPLGVRVELVHRGGDSLGAAACAQLLEPLVGEPVRGELCAEVAAALLGWRVASTKRSRTSSVRSCGRQDHALLVEGVREGRQARGLNPPDVGVMRARDREPEGSARDESHVGQMRAARVRVVEDGDLADLEPEPHHRGHGVGHRAEMDRDVLGLRNHPAALVEQRGRAVAPLLDVGGEGGTDQDGSHLLGDRPQGGADHLELNWCDLVTHVSAPSWNHP